MSQSTTFLLAPPSSSPSTTLPESPTLALLPFSLGASSAAYTSSSSLIPRYFRPRLSTPLSDSSLAEGSTIASFRGRQVVGQYVEVPKGYKGVILGTSKRPDMGGVEARGNTDGSEDRRYPLTPASSAPSVASTSTSTDIGADGENRRSMRNAHGRVRGAGQVALSRPRTRAPPNSTATRKRFRLDSDSEDSDEEDAQGQSSTLTRTPSKRARSALKTPKKPAVSDTVKEEGCTPIPEIVIQEATPLKHPLPTPKKRLSRRRASPAPSPVPKVVPQEMKMKMEMDVDGDEERIEDVAMIASDSDSPSPCPSSSDGQLVQQAIENEQLIPSPATEDDPPAFDITAASNTKAMEISGGGSKEETSFSISTAKGTDPIYAQTTVDDTLIDEYANGGPVRVLRPVAKFEGFMLYTPDVPLAGYRQDELSHQAEGEGEGATNLNETKMSLGPTTSSATLVDSETNSSDMTDDNNESREVLKESGEVLKKGWWRTGGAGEGGDEVVRALGEWLGLNEILHAPVYLEGNDDESDDE